ncbi:hypothetical protein E1294_36965 [Nonomuraea diastatica]|uniref:Dienelactone hydrolase domain-containing protein n=1 Tax=Nonomuraea diastatica TaxID=1848329 RepID=A0A4R4W7H5_9ACTN|nr:hypothetical protein E1294_36965 [Nonomuraea diastatica]
MGASTGRPTFSTWAASHQARTQAPVTLIVWTNASRSMRSQRPRPRPRARPSAAFPPETMRWSGAPYRSCRRPDSVSMYHALPIRAADRAGPTGVAGWEVKEVWHVPGDLVVPGGARGVVLFVHGSGSGRLSPRNRYVAGALNEAGLGTLLFDLLTPEEETVRANVFDIGLLTGRLLERTAWVREQPATASLPIGYFGASTGAAAALAAAAEPGNPVAAIVSRGGRPDLAAEKLTAVRAPTLLIVGGRDPVVLKLNEEAQRRLNAESRLSVVPGATHLFEEPGALEIVADQAGDWFTGHFSTIRR